MTSENPDSPGTRIVRLTALKVAAIFGISLMGLYALWSVRNLFDGNYFDYAEPFSFSTDLLYIVCYCLWFIPGIKLLQFCTEVKREGLLTDTAIRKLRQIGVFGIILFATKFMLWVSSIVYWEFLYVYEPEFNF